MSISKRRKVSTVPSISIVADAVKQKSPSANPRVRRACTELTVSELHVKAALCGPLYLSWGVTFSRTLTEYVLFANGVVRRSSFKRVRPTDTYSACRTPGITTTQSRNI